MVAPLTWQNIAIPNIGAGQAMLGAVASRDMNNAFKPLQDLADKVTESENAKWDHTADLNNDEISARLRGMEGDDIMNATAADFSNEFGVQFDRGQAATAIEKQQGIAKGDAVSQAINRMGDTYSSDIDTRNNFEESLKAQGFSGNTLRNMTNTAMEESATNRSELKTKFIETNTASYLKDLTPQNLSTRKAEAYEKYGAGNFDEKIMDTQAAAAGEQQSVDAFNKVSSFAQNNPNANMDSIREYTTGLGLPAEVALKTLEKMKPLYAKSATQTQMSNYNTEISAAQARIDVNTSLDPVASTISATQQKIDSNEYYQNVLKRVDDASVTTASSDQSLLDAPTTLKMGGIDSDAIKAAREDMRAIGPDVSEKVINVIFARLANSASINNKEWNMPGTQKKAFKSQAIELAQSYQKTQNQQNRLNALKSAYESDTVLAKQQIGKAILVGKRNSLNSRKGNGAFAAPKYSFRSLDMLGSPDFTGKKGKGGTDTPEVKDVSGKILGNLETPAAPAAATGPQILQDSTGSYLQQPAAPAPAPAAVAATLNKTAAEAPAAVPGAAVVQAADRITSLPAEPVQEVQSTDQAANDTFSQGFNEPVKQAAFEDVGTRNPKTKAVNEFVDSIGPGTAMAAEAIAKLPVSVKKALSKKLSTSEGKVGLNNLGEAALSKFSKDYKDRGFSFKKFMKLLLGDDYDPGTNVYTGMTRTQ